MILSAICSRRHAKLALNYTLSVSSFFVQFPTSANGFRNVELGPEFIRVICTALKTLHPLQ